MSKVYEDFEDELDAIRVALYEEVKDLPEGEIMKWFHDQVAPTMKRLGLQYSTLRPVQPHKRERI